MPVGRRRSGNEFTSASVAIFSSPSMVAWIMNWIYGDERIPKIQTIKMMDGIFICAATHCLKSSSSNRISNLISMTFMATFYSPTQRKKKTVMSQMFRAQSNFQLLNPRFGVL